MKDISETINKGADLLHRLAGPTFDEFGAILADKVRVYRAKNLVATVKKTERILRDAGLSPNAVPARLLFPIVEASSIEDDETLQGLWAGLLATASQQTDAVSPSFIETLKQMTPDEARVIDHVYTYQSEPKRHSQLHFGRQSTETYERLGLIRREYGMTEVDGTPAIGSLLRFTDYGIEFLKACRGPRKTE